MLYLKSAKNSGLFDPQKNMVKIRGKSIPIAPNLVVSPGDKLLIKGEEFAVLPASPSLFREFANRSAQIIQPWDAAVIMHYSDITAGKRVMETGVGSGALSIAILNTIGKDGKLTSVECEKKNIEIAKSNSRLVSEFKNWEIIESRIEDYESDEVFDAVILDIPEPWNVVGKISKNIVKGGRICCYSPTYNQMEKNVAALKESGYLVLESMEILKRDILVRENSTRPNNDIIGHTAFLTFAVRLSGITNRT